MSICHPASSIGLAIAGISLWGCAAVPFPTTVDALPFDDSEIAFIEPGATAREQVLQVFGEPDVARADSSVTLYGKARRVAGVMAGAMGTSGSIAPIETLHVLMVRYDSNDVVRAVDRLRFGVQSGPDCTADGICIQPRFEPGRTRSLLWEQGDSTLVKAIVFDHPHNDAAAKQFDLHESACSVYVYHNERLLGDRDIVLYRGSPPGDPVLMDENGFLHWSREPGPVAVSATVLPHHHDDSATTLPVAGDMEALEFNCDAGNEYFVDVDLREGFFKFVLELSLDDSDTGRRSVRMRRLMID